jgi:sn-glycerol 3-phosphate transport system substrate-binding protein
MVPGNRTQMGGAAWYLLNTVPDQVQAAAWDFITFINSNEAQVKLLTGGSFIPWRTSTLDDPEVVAYFESGLSGRWLRIAAEQLQRIDPDFPGPLIGPYDPETRDAIERAMESMLLNGVSPQQALEQAQRDIDAALELYNSF